MEFHQYMPTPKDKQEEIVKERNQKDWFNIKDD
jgi:hypothetical protein